MEDDLREFKDGLGRTFVFEKKTYSEPKEGGFFIPSFLFL